MRDIYSKDMKEILDKERCIKKQKNIASFAGSSKFVKLYKNKEPIFTKHNVENEIIKMFDSEVKLKSGGYIVINPTEALFAIDINSGEYEREY